MKLQPISLEMSNTLCNFNAWNVKVSTHLTISNKSFTLSRLLFSELISDEIKLNCDRI